MARFAAALCLILLALAAPARAQTEIHRCIGANGGPVFTDQPCAALQATPVMPGRTDSGSSPISAPLPTLCASNRDALRQSVIDAFAARNANRLAGMMLWNGYGRGAAIADIRSLNALMKHPLLDVEIPDPEAVTEPASTSSELGGMSADPFAPQLPVDPSPPASSAPAVDELVLHTAGNDGSGSPHERRFAVVHRAGCLWLRSLD